MLSVTDFIDLNLRVLFQESMSPNNMDPWNNIQLHGSQQRKSTPGGRSASVAYRADPNGRCASWKQFNFLAWARHSGHSGRRTRKADPWNPLLISDIFGSSASVWRWCTFRAACLSGQSGLRCKIKGQASVFSPFTISKRAHRSPGYRV